MRLIDADALKENIQSCDCHVLSPMITSVLLYMIDNQPTVEAIIREQYHDMTERFFDEFVDECVDKGANEETVAKFMLIGLALGKLELMLFGKNKDGEEK